ncbi:MAG TPA: hypothetical protein VHC72_14935 [Bryobacteraceae bacterium]|nr:hypothetical protein [Bryobacteraceae bacterium]
MKQFSRRALSALALSGLAFAAAKAGLDVDLRVPPDHPAIAYMKTPPDDPVARLVKRLESGKAKLEYVPGRAGYLPSLLKNLDINVDSQMLVFSKTSFQAPLISPRAPRALFFNDEVSVGSVKNGEVLELASLDPKQGVIFYTLNVEKMAKPYFARRDECLQCHQVQATLGIPGLEVGSAYPRSDGTPLFQAGYTAVDHRIPIEKRWGGWFVTGTSGNTEHLGNAIVPDPSNPKELDRSNSLNLKSLEGKVDLTGYMAQTSDIVALMTLEHQTRMTNLIIRSGWEERVAEHDGKLAEATPALETDIDELVAYMLFVDETPLKDPIAGVSTFTKTFQQRGPRDKQGRSLRDFDLKTRMFKYPLSYMIYSEAFDNMPAWVRERVYRKLYDVLTNKDTGERYQKIPAADRQAVLEILRDTKPNLPDYWKSAPAATPAAAPAPDATGA